MEGIGFGSMGGNKRKFKQFQKGKEQTAPKPAAAKSAENLISVSLRVL
jgi:hypothetical protein